VSGHLYPFRPRISPALQHAEEKETGEDRENQHECPAQRNNFHLFLLSVYRNFCLPVAGEAEPFSAAISASLAAS